MYVGSGVSPTSSLPGSRLINQSVHRSTLRRSPTHRDAKAVAPVQWSPRVMASTSAGYAWEGGTSSVVPVSTMPRLLPVLRWPPPVEYARGLLSRWGDRTRQTQHIHTYHRRRTTMIGPAAPPLSPAGHGCACGPARWARPRSSSRWGRRQRHQSVSYVDIYIYIYVSV